MVLCFVEEVKTALSNQQVLAMLGKENTMTINDIILVKWFADDSACIAGIMHVFISDGSIRRVSRCDHGMCQEVSGSDTLGAFLMKKLMKYVQENPGSRNPEEAALWLRLHNRLAGL